MRENWKRMHLAGDRTLEVLYSCATKWFGLGDRNRVYQEALGDRKDRRLDRPSSVGQDCVYLNASSTIRGPGAQGRTQGAG
jgi:hypothetical protein